MKQVSSTYFTHTHKENEISCYSSSFRCSSDNRCSFNSMMLLAQSYLGDLGMALRTCGAHWVSPHVLKDLPCDVILENGF